MKILRRYCDDQPCGLRDAIEESLLRSNSEGSLEKVFDKVVHITEALSIVIGRLAEKGLLSSDDIASMLCCEFDIEE